jgi:hypothetical protein
MALTWNVSAVRYQELSHSSAQQEAALPEDIIHPDA